MIAPNLWAHLHIPHGSNRLRMPFSGSCNWIGLIVALLISTPVHASLKDIHVERLPQDKVVLKVYADVGAVENLVNRWQPEWTFETPKAQVVDLLSNSLVDLRKAESVVPSNEELLLLVGLVSSYAYNLDVDGSYDLATDAFARAQKLAPDDYRPEWFLGALQCQTLESNQGMAKLLSIEGSKQWDQLAVGYWDDYLNCSNITNMPAHALRAASHIAKLGAVPSSDRDFLIETARNRFDSPDPAKPYSWTEIWNGEQSGSSAVFTNTMFGIQFPVPADWRASFGDVQKGVSTVHFVIGPLPGKTGGVMANILVFMRAQKAGETLADFAKSLMASSTLSPLHTSVCPTQECLLFANDIADADKDEGGGRVTVTVFKRTSPEFPGLLFEEPSIPPSGDTGKTTFSRPVRRIRRIQGTLYYLVRLDTAESVMPRALNDYYDFLQNIRVE